MVTAMHMVVAGAELSDKVWRLWKRVGATTAGFSEPGSPAGLRLGPYAVFVESVRAIVRDCDGTLTPPDVQSLRGEVRTWRY